jgi:hypothetical protein
MGRKPNPKPNLISFGAPKPKTVGEKIISKPEPARTETHRYLTQNRPTAILTHLLAVSFCVVTYCSYSNIGTEFVLYLWSSGT